MPLGHMCTSFCYVPIYGEAYEMHMLNFSFIYLSASLVTQTVKNPPANQVSWVRTLGWEDPLVKGMATHSNILDWRIPGDRGIWQSIVRRVRQSQTQLND